MTIQFIIASFIIQKALNYQRAWITIFKLMVFSMSIIYSHNLRILYFLK